MDINTLISLLAGGGSYQGVSNDIHVLTMSGAKVGTVTLSDQTYEPEGACYDYNTGLFYVVWGNGTISFVNMKAFYEAAEIEEMITVM